MIPALLLLAAAWPARAATVRGTVLGSPDGAPVAGAIVSAWNRRLDTVAVVADDDGRFELSGLSAGRWRLWAIPPAGDPHAARFLPDERDFCASDPLDLSADDTVEDVDFLLPLGASLSGCLALPDGSPAAGATVVARAVDPDVATASRSAASGDDGCFEVAGLDAPPGGALEWRVEVSADELPDQYLGGTYDEDEAEVFAVPEGGAVELGARTVLPGIAVGGRVTAPDGSPVAGADVYVYSNGLVRHVETGEDGRYRAAGLPAGEPLPWVSAEGLAVTYWPGADRPTGLMPAMDEGEEVDDADLSPPWEAVLSVRLLGAADGRPAAGVTGLLYNDTGTVGRGATADADGVLTIDRLWGGRYTLYAWGARAGLVDDWVRDEDGEVRVFELEDEEEAGPLDAALPAASLLSGVVLGPDGEPVPGATVLVERASDGGWAATTAGDDGAWTADGLPAGRWRIEAIASAPCADDPGYVTTWWPAEPNGEWAPAVEVAEGDAVDGLDVELPRDDDHDGMADEWERRWGLDPDRDDAGEDPDGDGYDNLTEYLLDTPPVEGGPARGCGGGAAGLLLAPAVVARRRRRR